MLDGDEMRRRVSPDLGFSRADREAHLRRAGIVASEVVKHGGIVICAFIAPYEQSRREIRDAIEQYGRFFLVHVSTPPAECERRDPKGVYRKARAGLLPSFTGISDIYEAPTECDVAIDTTGLTVFDAADRVGRGLAAKGLMPGLWLASGLHLAPPSAVKHGDTHAPFPATKEERRARLFQCVLQAAAERRVTLREVAREVGVERHTIEKVVRSATGQSFRQFQGALLFERAKILLEQGKSIKEVAFELGFGHPQSFHRFVRKSAGVTPSSLRRKAS
jgi:adenylylsulfate kinase-like enzyme/AraC-like DNA-binding protein